MEQRIVVVSESPPRLTEFDAGPARKFLKDYAGYKLRVADLEALVPMYRLVKPEDLETLLECTEEGLRERNIRVVRQRAQRAARDLPERQPREHVPAAEVAAEEGKEAVGAREGVPAPDIEEEVLESVGSDEDTVPERVIYWLSNEHIEEMIVDLFGPGSQSEAISLLKAIKMSKDVPFAKLSEATNHRRDWKLMLKWCKNHIPKGKSLVKQFLYSVKPKELATALECLEYENIDHVMDAFVREYKDLVKASKNLTRMGILLEEKAVGKPNPKKGGTSDAKGEQIVKGASEKGQSTLTVVKDKKNGLCWNCNSPDHMRPNCPLLKKDGVKLGALLKFNAERIGPYLVIDLCAPGGVKNGDQVLRAQGFFDSGAGGNAVGRNMVSHLELCGGEIKPLAEPIEVEWLDKEVKRTITQTIDMQVAVVGTNLSTVLTFMVAPWDMDNIVIGWPTQQRFRIMDSLSDWIVMQRSMNICIGNTLQDENTCVSDLDGKKVAVDEYIWVDEPSSDAEPIESVLSPDEQRVLDAVLEEYADVFTEKPVGSANVEPMIIEMKDGWTPPPMGPSRHYSPKVQAAIDFDLAKLLEKGIVSPCPDASFACDVHAVPKPDSESGYRFCVDYRPINAGVKKTPYPLPKINDILSDLGKLSYVGKMDLRWGYWQFPVDPGSRRWLAFRVRGKFYSFNVVSMGFVNAGYHVMAQMEKGFQEVPGEFIHIYLDDLLFGAETFDGFIVVLRRVLGALRRMKLTCKQDKCGFGLSKLPILGHVWTRHGIQMSEERKKAIDAIPFPRSMFELRRFLGMTNYQRMFIPRYSILAKPLSSQVNTPVSLWDRDKMAESFRVLKNAVQTQAKLTHLDYSLPLVLQTDGSIVGIAAMLANRLPSGLDRIVAYFSHALSDSEAKWKTIEIEAFAIVRAVIHFRSLLWGHHFLIETDHRNLTYIHGGTSAKLARWSMMLQNFDYSLVYKPGPDIPVPDTLSRAPAGRAISLQALRVSDFIAEPIDAQDGALGAVSDDVETKQHFEWFLQVHNDTEGHMGSQETLRRLTAAGTTWRRMSRDVARWISVCAHCQKYRAGPLPQVIVTSRIAAYQIFEELGVDFIGPLPKDQLGNSYICNCVCMTTRYVELFAVEAATGGIAAHCLLSVVARYGCFRRIRSDRGTHFVNEVIEEFLRIFEIQHVLTLAERPEANGIVERMGGEEVRHLKALTAAKDLKQVWSIVLPLSQRIINKTWKASIRNCPHNLMYFAPTDLNRGILSPFVEPEYVPPLKNDYVKQLHTAYERLLDETSLFMAAEQERLGMGQLDVDRTVYSPGELVLMSYKVRPPSKLHARWAGPYEVMSMDGNNLSLRDLTGGPNKDVDVSRVKLFQQDGVTDPKALAAADMGEIEVEEILAHRGSPRKRSEMEFQVKWSDGDITWEPWERVRRLEAIDVYARSQPRLKVLIMPEKSK